jgi:hypothetical protein
VEHAAQYTNYKMEEGASRESETEPYIYNVNPGLVTENSNSSGPQCGIWLISIRIRNRSMLLSVLTITHKWTQTGGAISNVSLYRDAERNWKHER